MFKKFLSLEMVRCLLVFIFFFSISLFFQYMIVPYFCDEIWNYGFSYNISQGMVIYRDFNVLQTPLYFFIGSLFIKIFGNYMISIGIFNSILIGFISIILYKCGGFKYLFLVFVLFLFDPSGYNIFLILLCLIILYLIYINKDYDILIGLLVSLLFLVKQNIGIVMIIPCLYYSKNRVKCISSFMLPIFILCIYLVWNNALFSFIDYAFLGLFDFQDKNLSINIFNICLEVIICIFLIIRLFKTKFKDKLAFYVLCFQFISYPIFDFRHFAGALFIFLCYCCISYFNISFISKVVVISLQIGICISYFSVLLNNISSFNIVFDKNNLFYLSNSGSYIDRLEVIHEYLDSKDDYDYYFTELYGYLYKLYYNIPVNRYDFMISGNMGYFNKDKIYNEIENNCKINKCVFFVDASYLDDGSQWKETSLWIKSKYNWESIMYPFEIYSNRYIMYK